MCAFQIYAPGQTAKIVLTSTMTLGLGPPFIRELSYTFLFLNCASTLELR
jgi:hypothetical protein